MDSAAKYRFRLTSESIINAAPIVESFPSPRRAGDPPLTVINDAKHYMVTATSFRGRIRRRAFLNILHKAIRHDPTFQFTSADARLMMIGGVKGSGRSDHLSPIKTAEVRDRRPDLELFGMNDPTFLHGCLAVGMMTSIAPVRTDRIDPDTTIPIIRRSLLNDPSLIGVKLSDAWTMDEFAELNHQRSAFDTALRIMQRLERRAMSDVEKRTHAKAVQTLTEIAHKPIGSLADANEFLAEMRAKMRDDGHSDVSEANIQSAATIPAGTPMRQIIRLDRVSLLGTGLFLSALHDAWAFDPAIGGMAARGAGGYLTMLYNVERQEGYEWVPDCKLQVTPDVGIEIIVSNSQRVSVDPPVFVSAFEAWQKVNITDFDFTVDGLRTFMGTK